MSRGTTAYTATTHTARKQRPCDCGVDGCTIGRGDRYLRRCYIWYGASGEGETPAAHFDAVCISEGCDERIQSNEEARHGYESHVYHEIYG